MMFKRRKQKKTNYKKRIGLLKSGKPRLVSRRFNNSFIAQIVEFEPGRTDIIVASASSAELKKLGWIHHGGNTPAAYLVGYLAGKKALAKGIKEAVPDIGLHISSKGSSVYAVLLGAKHAGIDVPFNEEMMPEQRALGEHIKSFAGKDIPADVEAVKKKIDESYKG